MPTTTDQQKRRIIATAAPTGDLPPSSDSEAPVPHNTSKKERDDDNTATRVSPGTRQGERKSDTQRPLGRSGGTLRHHRVGVGQARQRFLPTSHTYHPGPIAGSTLPTAHHHSHKDTTVVSPRQTSRGRPGRTKPPLTGAGSTAATWEGTTSTGTSGSRPDAEQAGPTAQLGLDRAR